MRRRAVKRPENGVGKTQLRLLELYLRDRLVQLTLIVILTVCVLSALGVPLFENEWESEWLDSEALVLIPLLVIAIFSFELTRIQARSKQERYFWRLFSLSSVAWLLGETIYLIVPSSISDLNQERLNDVLLTAVYVFALVALQMGPHEDTSQSLGDVRGRDVDICSTVLFALILLTYFSFIPTTTNPTEYLTWVPSMLNRVLFDVYLMIAMVYSARVSNQRRWKTTYSTLAAAALIWTVADAAEGFSYMGFDAEGFPWWRLSPLVAMPLLIGTARLSREPFVSMTDFNARSSETTPTGTAWDGQLVWYAFVLPLVHIGLSVPGADDEATQGARKTLVLGSMLFFGTAAIVRQRWLLRRQRQLSFESQVVEDKIRTVEEEARALRYREKMDKALQHTQRLESLGLLAGGIAHDFNNLLTIIIGRASLTREHVSKTSPANEHLECIETASERAAELTAQMLAYAGKTPFNPQAIDLNTIIKEVEPLIRSSTTKDAVLDLQIAERLPPAYADASQIKQVVMNLVTNASDALEESQGTIRIRTGTTQELLDEQLQSGPDTAVFLEVSDTGCGIDGEVRERLFEPFFTTKAEGRGLGLAAVFGIMTSHSGKVVMESTPGRGSTFRALFPALGADAVAELAQPAHLTQDAKRNLGTILIVDDEAAVRRTVATILRSAGAQVLIAENGEMGLAQFRAHPDITAAVVDLTMPGMKGTDVVRQMRHLRKDVPIVMISGYSPARPLCDGTPGPPVFLVTKPFRASELVEVLGEALESRIHR